MKHWSSSDHSTTFKYWLRFFISYHLNSTFHIPDLIVLCIIASPAAHCDIYTFGVPKISVASFSAAILETCQIEFTYQFPDLGRHYEMVPL